MTALDKVIIRPNPTLPKALTPGDLLESWRLQDVTYPIKTPYDVWYMAKAQEIAGGVVLTYVQDGHTRGLTLKENLPWEDLVRPQFVDEDEQVYLKGVKEGGAHLSKLAVSLAHRKDYDAAAWIWCTHLASGDQTTEAYQRAASISKGQARAWAQHLLGDHLIGQGQFQAAYDAHTEAVQLRKTRPLLHAHSLSRLAVAAYLLGKSKDATESWRLSREILRPIAPESMLLARINGNLGLMAQKSSHLMEARELLLESLRVKQRQLPGSKSTANTLLNLAGTQRLLGDIQSAEEYALRALKIYRDIELTSGRVDALSQLGHIQHNRHDYRESKRYYTQALSLHGHEDDLTAMALFNGLGAVDEELGHLDSAHDYYARAVAIAKGKGSQDLARYLANQALLEIKRRQPQKALDLLTQAHDSLKAAPNQALLAFCLSAEARALQKLDKHDAAAEKLSAALAIRRKVTPDSYALADLLKDLGLHHRRRKEWPLALTYLEEGIEVLERQLKLLGGGRIAEMNFLEAFHQNYKALIETQVAMGRNAAAFASYERYRGRVLLGMLLTRDLNLFVDRPQLAASWQATLRDLANHHRQLKQIQTPAERQRQRDKIAEGYRELGRLQAEVHGGIAALRFPKPLSAKQIAAALDPGTLLLAYCVGQDQSTLFAVMAGGNGEPQVFNLPVGEKTLANRIKHLRKAIDKGPDRAARHQKRLYGEAAYLYRKLLAPAEEHIQAAQRLLIIADGPLAQLPFATLVGDDEQRDYLITRKPLHTTVSATVYARLLQDRPQGRTPPDLTVFANPSHGDWPDLPRAAAEGQGIAKLFGTHSRLFRGQQASESQLASLERKGGILHFATHGYLDNRFPLESALILTPADPEDGRLQVWEILERYRLQRSLVTLSGCETGQGEDVGGNGLLGLTLAFQATGARSVLASLWRVSDSSTELLMKRFYANLKQGLPKDQAFRRAQLDFIQRRDVKEVYDDPFHWGAFILSGDYK